MSPISKVLVMRDAEPFVGAEVLVSQLFNKWRETDEAGQVAYTVDESTAYAGLVAIRDEEGDIFKYHIVLDAGETETVVIPNINYPV